MANENTERKSSAAKGANLPLSGDSKSGGKKKVLGRGLNALMAASSVKVDFSGDKAENTGSRDSKPFSFKPGAAVPRPEELQRSISREQALSRPQFVETPAEEQVPPEGGLVYLTLDRVVTNPKQPRKHFSESELKELADSIRLSGVLQPIVVRRQAGVGGPLAKYEIIAGERRFRAASKVGIQRIPALVRQMSDREVLEVSIVENVQREDLNPIEEAQAFSRLVEEFGASQEEVASAVGKSRSAVANTLRLLKLGKDLQQLLLEGALSAGHARAILVLDSEKSQQILAREIQKSNLSVRDAEKRASEMLAEGTGKRAEASKKSQEADATVVAIEQKLRRLLGTKVKLNRNKAGRGELRISFFSDEELENIIERFEQA
jgi:ParB family chromosome partitioning protein